MRGSVSNLYAIIVARHSMFPDYKKNGLRELPKPLVMFTSEHCHYSIKSAAMVTGLGTQNCVEVPADEKGRMIPAELERLVQKAISEGKHPYFVNCTSGTTVFGAFDPINELADICDKYNMWLHIDGAWGASILMSNKYRNPRFDGVTRARSISWNPHKLMTTHLQCSTIHFRERGLLRSCNSMHAEYLFQQDKHYDVKYDTGDKVIQCGRHNDIFKFWLQWRAHGTIGLERDIDHMMGIMEYQVDRFRSQPEKFYLIVPEPECTNVCFWYVPTRLRGMQHTKEREHLLGEVCSKLKQRMMEAGTLMIGYQPQGDIPNFFRSIISNPAVKRGDIDFMISELDRLGHDL
ncbi:Glutamate decarboxylase [Orchesella cincta]|uniref:Glutamate decarboxylase n=1 Tax=Orchesella cincta TaxID=48709 RepID=A0A1D2MGZ1_ORCCI|nr:Glutamate decarboxylase [Orchesella cincta]